MFKSGISFSIRPNNGVPPVLLNIGIFTCQFSMYYLQIMNLPFKQFINHQNFPIFRKLWDILRKITLKNEKKFCFFLMILF